MNVSIKINEDIVKALTNKYKKYQLDNTTPYMIFFSKIDDTTITIFKSTKKNSYSLTITSNIDEHVNKIIKENKLEEYIDKKIKSSPKKIESKKFIYLEDQIGSDEVGTGDFFGPVTVVASLVRKKDLPRLKELGVTDSKKMTDEKILKLGKILIKEFPYSSMLLNNVKYNEIVDKGFNEVKIKTFLHNQALYLLSKKHPEIKHIYVDQFVSSKIYYKYLIDEKNVIKNVFFHTKGETYFPSVALSSVIARYSFLINMEKLNKKYNCKFPFGTNEKVEKFALDFLKKYGIKEFDKVVKKHFKTYKKIIALYNEK